MNEKMGAWVEKRKSTEGNAEVKRMKLKGYQLSFKIVFRLIQSRSHTCFLKWGSSDIAIEFKIDYIKKITTWIWFCNTLISCTEKAYINQKSVGDNLLVKIKLIWHGWPVVFYKLKKKLSQQVWKQFLGNFDCIFFSKKVPVIRCSLYLLLVSICQIRK